MPNSRDLLFALTAHTLGLATRESVLKAAFAWSGDSEEPLQGLAAEDRSALEAVVAAIERKHGGDTLRALASTPIDAAMHRALLGMRFPAPLLSTLQSMKPPSAGAEERYRFGAEIGRGGLGRVVEALDSTLGRDVAIKLVLPELPPVLQERFAREARLTAKLDHPHIVPVHDFGEIPSPSTGSGRSGRQLFLCMKRVHGRSLAEVVAQLAKGEVEAIRKWSRARLLGVLQDICLGVAYAHSKGIIHRDLKPSNVMLGDFGETLILDWGLARETGDPPEADPGMRTRLRAPKTGSSTLTMEGDVLGTPAYMPPEQANGHLNTMDARSDVFSLGAILYELLTFHPPYRGTTPDDVLVLAQAGKVPAPSQSRRDVPAALDAICARACSPRREDRYPTALALHHDLQQFLEGVAERERKRSEAATRMTEAQGFLRRARELGAEIHTAHELVVKLQLEIPRTASIEERKRIWDAEEKHSALLLERVQASERADALFAEVLTTDASRYDARAGRISLHLDRYLEAEMNGYPAEMEASLARLLRIDPAGTFQAILDAPGRLSLSAHEYTCDCLRPLKPGVLRLEIETECTVAWRDGAPLPGVPLQTTDHSVPVIRMAPASPRFGHVADCPRRVVPGVSVRIARYEKKERRLVLGEESPLGETPLAPVSLAPGSYRCRLVPPAGSGLAEALVPVRIERGAKWEQDVALYRVADVPAGFRLVSAGPVIMGGATVEYHTAATRDVFVAALPVTCAEYLEFINDLCARSPQDARRHVPRDTERTYWIEEPKKKRFRFPTPAEDRKFAWRPDWPVFSVTWHDAIAYIAWKSARDGRPYSLQHEFEQTKSVRGVDKRLFAFGDHAEGKWFHCAASVATGITPLPVGSFPIDESPYGIRDALGGVCTWCLNAGEEGIRHLRVLLGIGWNASDQGKGITQRNGGTPDMLRQGYGIRLCWRPAAWPVEPLQASPPKRTTRKRR